MKRILVAENPEAIPIMEEVLGDRFKVEFCTTLGDAESRLDQKIGLIVCGMHFHDGHMYDLLKLAKSLPQIAPIPFLCVRLLRGELRDEAIEAVQATVRRLGGDGFVDYFRWSRFLGDEYAKAKLRICLDYMALDDVMLDRRNRSAADDVRRPAWPQAFQ